MKQEILPNILALFLLFAASSSAVAADNVHCTECGMIVDMNSHFTAKIVQGKTEHFFCDIGDLFAYLNRTGLPKDAGAQVRDYATGQWIDASKAYYVQDGKKFRTPMGWGVAAFPGPGKAAESGKAMDFTTAVKALK